MSAAAYPPVGYMPMPAAFPHKEAFLHGRPQHRRYDDFWIRHPPMNIGHRAKIFAPFDALRGSGELCLRKRRPL